MHLYLFFIFSYFSFSKNREKWILQYTNTDQALLPSILPLSWGPVTPYAEDTLVSVHIIY